MNDAFPYIVLGVLIIAGIYLIIVDVVKISKNSSYFKMEARGKYLTLLGSLHGVNRKWYEIPYLLDRFYRKRIMETIRGIPQ